MARQLVEADVAHVFGIPGVQLDHATNGLWHYRDQIQFVSVRHEQTTTYAADGYARSTGRIGVALVVPGPGVLNAGAGLVTALANSSRVLLVAGQIPTDKIGSGLGLLHEIPDQSALLESLCTSAVLARTAGEVAGSLHGAIQRLGGGSGPVAVEVPPDVLAAPTTGSPIGAEPARPPSPGEPKDLSVAAELLFNADRPVIYAGGGARAANAWAELPALAESLGAPLVASPNGKGAFDDRHSLAVMPLGHHELLARTDCVLFVGSRTINVRGGSLAVNPEATQISLNNRPEDLGPPRVFTHTIQGDARTGLDALQELVSQLNGGDRPPCWAEDLDGIQSRALSRIESLEPQLAYTSALRDAMPDEACLVNELTQIGYVSRYSFPIHHPRSYIDAGYQGTLGYGYPTAIGAAIGNPDRSVVCITGDGGFGYGMAEMSTVMRYDIPLVCIVFRDGSYGNVKRMHEQKFAGNYHGTKLHNPDIVELAGAYGMDSYRAHSPHELTGALAAAIDKRVPALIDVPVGPMPDPWPHVYRPFDS